MKRILFVITYFDCGGICRSLQNLLNLIDSNKYEIDVFGFVEAGMFEKGLFKNCRIIPEDKLLRSLYSRYSSTSGVKKYQAAISKIVNRLSGWRYNEWLLQRTANRIVSNGNYDMVVAFSEGIVTKFLSYVKHPNKVAWIHCDYANFHKLANHLNELPIYNRYKSIICVSEFTKSSFVSIYPELANRTQSIYNVLDGTMIKNQAVLQLPDGINFDTEYFNIVSVGRLDQVKRMSVIPEIANQLVKNGDKIKWYIVGPKGGINDEYQKLIDNIDRLNLNDTICYLGEQENPYPFIKNADLLVNTSISEACPYVINEAKILETPIVCTDFGSAVEFVEPEATGLISSIENMGDIIHRYINDTDLRQHIKENLKKFQYDNIGIMEKISHLID